MLEVSAAHRRVMSGDNPMGVVLLDLTTRTGSRKLSLSDYEAAPGYMPVSGVSFATTAQTRELGSGRAALQADASKRDWFVDSAGNILVAANRVVYGFAFLDQDNSVFLSPLWYFTGVGDLDGDNGYDDKEIVVSFKGFWAQVRQVHPWYLSRTSQRAIDPTDSFCDDIAAQRPIGGRA